jgi:hypothetical protein
VVAVDDAPDPLLALLEEVAPVNVSEGSGLTSGLISF